jgi:hypothetical protein
MLLPFYVVSTMLCIDVLGVIYAVMLVGWNIIPHLLFNVTIDKVIVEFTYVMLCSTKKWGDTLHGKQC